MPPGCPLGGSAIFIEITFRFATGDGSFHTSSNTQAFEMPINFTYTVKISKVFIPPIFDGPSMTYLNLRSARLKGDITALPRLGLIQASAIIVYPNLVRIQNNFSDILIEA